MGDVENMSDAEIRTKLIEFGFPVMPITGTTRKLMMKKLKLLMENKNKTSKDERLSLGRYSSEEESDTDVKSARKDKNRRTTMAAPPPQSPNRSGVSLRRSLHRNVNEDLSMPSVSKDGLKSSKHITTTTTKITKSVQDEFDTGSDSEPEIIENDYNATSKITNSYGLIKDSSFSPSSQLNFEQSSTNYVRPQTVTSHFSSNYASSSIDKPITSSIRYTSYNSSANNSGDATLDRLNQIRSRLSLGNQEENVRAMTSDFISIFAVLDFFEKKETLEKATDAIMSKCVTAMSFDPESFTVSGEVQATTKHRSYKVKVTVSNGTVKECNCDCYRGSTNCHHAAALILYAHYSLMDTDRSFKWNKNELFDNDLLTAEQFETDKKHNYLSEKIGSKEHVESKDLQLCSPAHFLSLLMPESGQNKNVLDVNEILLSKDYLQSIDKRIFLEKYLQLSPIKIQEISEITVGQNNNPLWFIARKHRLTASNFGKIIKACRRNRFPPSLFKSLIGFDRPTYSSTPDINKDKVETPFLSNFTRRLSQLSSNSSPKSDYDYKNDIIKEHDTNGAGAYNRIYTGRSTRYRDINRDYYSRHNTSIMKNNIIPLTLIVVAFLFFFVVAIMYYGMRSDDKALETTGYIIPRCNKADLNARPGINCVHDEDLEDAINLMKTIKPELLKRAVDFACKDSSDNPYMTESEVISYCLDTITDHNYSISDLENMEVLAFKNPDWGISIIKTNILDDNVLKNMIDVMEYKKLNKVGLLILHPSIPWRCIIYNKVHAIFNVILLLVGIFLISYFGNIFYKYVNHREQHKRNEIYNMVKQIIETLQSNCGQENEFLVINHVRDMILPINNRKYMEKTWDEAVKFINENESRVRTEVQVVQGEPYEVWRWLGSPNLNISGSPRSKTWQGQAFETQVGSVNSLPCSPTPCLKIRGMVDDNDSNLHGIREAVLSKCAHQCCILHCAIDTTSKCVYLKCADQNDAAVAYRNLHGWWYAGHLVTVKYLRLERYMQRFPDSPTQGPPFLRSLSPATDWSS